MKFGLIGEKLSHSYSPQIHNLIFKITGIRGEYSLYEIKRNDICKFIQNARQDKLAGLNVTIPYKTEVIRFLDGLSPEAKKINAVNTISFDGCLYGHNTDYYGLEYTFIKHGINIKAMKALITGSGGAAKAVTCYLADQQINKVYMASRNPSEAVKKCPGIIPVSYPEIKQYRPFDIIVNTTPVGMYPNQEASPLTAEELKGAGFLFDLIYNPPETCLIKTAKSLKIPNTNGLFMLVAQAVKAQEIWNGTEYGIDLVDRIVKEIVTD